MTVPDDFHARMEALGVLLETIERECAPEQLEPARALLRAVLDVHRSGLEELLDVVRRSPSSAELLTAFAERDSLASLFELHELTIGPTEGAGFVPVDRLTRPRGVER